MAEFPDFDFLPIVCDACKSHFCQHHFRYENHACKKGLQKDRQVPICPICNAGVALRPGQTVDEIISRHIDNFCDAYKQRISYRCGVKRCKAREWVEVRCDRCRQNFCLKHRFPTDHECQVSSNLKSNADDSSSRRSNAVSTLESDAELARRLQAEEYSNSGPVYGNRGGGRTGGQWNDSCRVI